VRKFNTESASTPFNDRPTGREKNRSSMRIKVLARELSLRSGFFESARASATEYLLPSLTTPADRPASDRLLGLFAALLKSIGVLTAATAALMIFNYLIPHDLEDLALLVYLAPVVVAAIWWGRGIAVATALLASAASAFFFTAPLYSFRIASPHQAVDLMVFLVVAVATGNLAARLKRELVVSRARESEIRGLYGFSRRLAAGFTAEDFIAAVQDYLSNTLGRPTILISPGDPDGVRTRQDAALRAEATAMMAANATAERIVADAQSGRLWLLQVVSSEATARGVIAVDLGSGSNAKVTRTTDQARNVLSETNIRLKQLEVGQALSAARSRALSDELRAALIGNVSHELRSPLASILGSATVLDRVPAIRQNDRMQSLVETVLEEAKRLDEDIQKLLDATRVAARDRRPQHKPIDVLELVNQSVARKHKQLAMHDVRVEVPTDLPRILADSALVEQAIGQLLENAAKYSAAGSLIKITARRDHNEVVVSVRDQGSGLTQAEMMRIGQQSFRGSRHRDLVPGSGLGLWIAHCFIAANGGTLQAETAGLGLGTTVSIRVRAEQTAAQEAAQVGHE
jgi:two-component system, OmpR family, sensor histidine kinase KdpD